MSGRDKVYRVPFIDALGYKHWRTVHAVDARMAKIFAEGYRRRNWLMGEPMEYVKKEKKDAA